MVIKVEKLLRKGEKLTWRGTKCCSTTSNQYVVTNFTFGSLLNKERNEAVSKNLSGCLSVELLNERWSFVLGRSELTPINVTWPNVARGNHDFVVWLFLQYRDDFVRKPEISFAVTDCVCVNRVSRTMPLPDWNFVLLISTVAANATMGNRVSYNELIDETVLKLQLYTIALTVHVSRCVSRWKIVLQGRNIFQGHSCESKPPWL